MIRQKGGTRNQCPQLGFAAMDLEHAPKWEKRTAMYLKGQNEQTKNDGPVGHVTFHRIIEPQNRM